MSAASPTTPPKIWALFSVDNNYDQPENNLVRWWATKPSIEELAKFMATPLDKATDEQIVAIVSLFKGDRVHQGLGINGAEYRLEEIGETF